MLGHATEADWGALTHPMKYDITGNAITNITDCGDPDMKFARPAASHGHGAKENANHIMALAPVTSSGTDTITYTIKIQNSLSAPNAGVYLRGNNTLEETHITFWEII